jgi:peptidoglycan/LPS O-acetylase OafA/YrhL
VTDPALPPSSVPRQETEKAPLLFLDGMRGLAAVFVMIHHARLLLWEGMAAFSRHPEQYSPFGRLLAHALAIFRYGHQGVTFFFVLSGFVIHYNYAGKLHIHGAAARFDLARYLFRRARRLYPPLLAAMLLTFALDRSGMLEGLPIYAGKTAYPVINGAVHIQHDALTAIGNLTFLMHALVPCWGSNGPLWSLHFEWWFYMLYPVLWMISRRSVPLAAFCVAIPFALSLPWPVWPLPGAAARAVPEFFSGLLIWCMGAALADVATGRTVLRLGWVAALSPMLVVAPFAATSEGWVTDTLYGLGFAGLLALCLWLNKRGFPLRWLNALKPLGDMSYTLYITHFPILVLLSGWLMSRAPGGILPMHFGWLAAGALLAASVAHGLHYIVEKPFLSRARASRS